MRMLCGDNVVVQLGGETIRAEVYGEVYSPKYWVGWHASREWHQRGIEVYINQVVYEIPTHKVVWHESR